MKDSQLIALKSDLRIAKYLGSAKLKPYGYESNFRKHWQEVFTKHNELLQRQFYKENAYDRYKDECFDNEYMEYLHEYIESHD